MSDLVRRKCYRDKSAVLVLIIKQVVLRLYNFLRKGEIIKTTPFEMALIIREFMIKRFAACLICLLLVACTLTGCADSKAEEEQAILDYVKSTGVVYVDQLTEAQRQRLLDAGIDGVEDELRKMVEEYVAENSPEPVLGPTVEFLRAWEGEKDGVSYVISLSKIESSEYDDLMEAYRDGGTEQLKACVEELWAGGWAAIREKTN